MKNLIEERKSSKLNNLRNTALVIVPALCLLTLYQSASAEKWLISFNRAYFLLNTDGETTHVQYSTIVEQFARNLKSDLPPLGPAQGGNRPRNYNENNVLRVEVQSPEETKFVLLFDRSRLYLRGIMNQQTARMAHGEYWFAEADIRYGGAESLGRATIDRPTIDNAFRTFLNVNPANGGKTMPRELHRLAVFFAESARFNFIRRDIEWNLANYTIFVATPGVYDMVTNWNGISDFMTGRPGSFEVNIPDNDVARWAEPRITEDQRGVWNLPMVQAFVLAVWFSYGVACK